MCGICCVCFHSLNRQEPLFSHTARSYATLRTCSPDPATITSDSGDTRYTFPANVKEIERLTVVATVSFTEESQYDRDPDAETEVLITDTRTISQDMAFFVRRL